MSRPWATVVLWGVFLAVLAAVTTPFHADVYTYSLLGGSALFILALGLVVLLTRADGAAAGEVRAQPGLSFPSMLLGLALATLALGAELGLWLLLIGAGLCVLAIGGLVRERRAEHRAAEEL